MTFFENTWFRPAKPDLCLPRVPLPIVHCPPVITRLVYVPHTVTVISGWTGVEDPLSRHKVHRLLTVDYGCNCYVESVSE